MTTPLAMLNEVYSDLVIRIQPLLEVWRDHNSIQFKQNCTDRLDQEYKMFTSEINTRFAIFQRAEKRLSDAYNELERISKKDYSL